MTDKPPRRKVQKEEYLRSDLMLHMDLPEVGSLRQQAKLLEQALRHEERQNIEKIANALTQEVTSQYHVIIPSVRVLGKRPLETTEDFVDEIYGDYDPETLRIRLWMRTAVLEKMTSYGTLLSTLCHEICHHLDVVKYDLPNTYHTRGFYQRAGLLYHHIRNTPAKNLVWTDQQDGTYRINWPETMRSGSAVKSISV